MRGRSQSAERVDSMENESSLLRGNVSLNPACLLGMVTVFSIYREGEGTGH